MFLGLNNLGSFAMYHYMKVSALFFSAFFLLGGSFVHAAKVEVIQVPSAKMEKKFRPPLSCPMHISERDAKSFPFFIFLHGAGGTMHPGTSPPSVPSWRTSMNSSFMPRWRIDQLVL